MILKKHKKIIVLFVALFVFYTIINGAFSIYRETKGDSILLNILGSNEDVAVTFDANGGTINAQDVSRVVPNGTAVGQLPTVTRTDHNFLGWYTDPSVGEEISDETIVTGTTVTYYAHWAKFVCKKAGSGTLHTETCNSDGSCIGVGYNENDTITYGTIPGVNSPIAGDAYDCDVNNDDVWDDETERFYYIRAYGSTNPTEYSVLVHYTSFDELGQMDSSSSRGSYHYSDAYTYLPTSSTWSNPALIEMNGKVTRFPSRLDVTTVCGSDGGGGFQTCQFLLENTRFQSDSLGRAGIWLDVEGNNYYRIQSKNRIVASVQPNGSDNTARPTIQIPSNTIEGYKDLPKYKVHLYSEGGTPSDYLYDKYDGQIIGSLPSPSKEGSIFVGWFTDNVEFTTMINENTVVTSNINAYAKWIDGNDPLDYVFYIPGECTFTGSSLTNGPNSNCVSIVNPTGSPIDYTESTLSSKKYIDTGVALYNSINNEKDFEVGLTIIEFDPSANTNRATLVNSKAEVDSSSLKFPGFTLRRNNETSDLLIQSRKELSSNGEFTTAASGVRNVKIYRTNGDIYYSINGGEKTFLHSAYNPIFDLTTWFGAAPTNSSASSAQRFLKGTLSNMYIKLASDKISVTFDPNYQGSSTFTRKVTKGSAIGGLPTYDRAGYTLEGWYTEAENGTKIDENTIINGENTYYAHWLENITVTFDADGGTVSPNTRTFSPNTAIGELPIPTKTGYTFIGWYSDDTEQATEVTDETVFSTSTTIYARWVEDITVTFNASGGNVSINSKSFTPNTAIGELPIPTKTGFIFLGWYSDDTEQATEVTAETVFNATTTIYAKWLESITITFNANGGSVSPNTRTFAVGSAIGELPTPSRIGYVFLGWYSDDTEQATEITAETVFNSSTTIYAKWLESITITFNANGGSVSPNTRTFAAGNAIGELPTPLRDGYRFLGWFSDDTEQATEVTDETIFNTTTSIYARWEEILNYKITYDAMEGTVSPEYKEVEIDTAAGELAIPEKENQIFVGWFTDNIDFTTEITDETIITDDITVYAKWVDETYVACIGSTCYTSLATAVDNVPTTGTITSIKLIQNTTVTSKITIASTKNIELNLQTFTITSSATSTFENSGTLHIKNGEIISSSSDTTNGNVIKNLRNATLNISGGTIKCTGTMVISNAGNINVTGGRILGEGQPAAINNYQYGVLNVSSGQIIGSNTTKGQAIYNNKGTLTISGDAYLENNSQSSSNNGRAAVHNNDGTVYITGGTIVSKNNAAVKNNATMTIGIDDDSISTTSPLLKGSTYGLEAVSGKTLNVYDGIFKGVGTNKAINNESYVNHGNVDIVHVTEIIDGLQYDVAYLYDPLVNYTVTFNTNGGTMTSPTTRTFNEVSTIGSLPTANKSNTAFLGWYTAASGGNKILTTDIINEDVTVYAHYTTSKTVCKRATTLHTSGNTTFGQIPNGQTLTSGDAFDCDVNGDGTYDSATERFYYLTDDSNGNAVLIYYNNTVESSNGLPICNANASAYGSTSVGPSTSYVDLPTIAQWKNVSLYSQPRTITNANGTVISSNYSYIGRSSRFATLDEIKAATKSTINSTAGELASYPFLLENTSTFSDGCRPNYWLETVKENNYVYRIDGEKTSGKKLGYSSGVSGVRPVIEVPHTSIEGVVDIVEFDTIPTAMRNYFNNVSSWNAGQNDSNYSSFNNAMTSNLSANNCVYYENDNVGTEYGSVYCDQPNKYDTGTTGSIIVYEYNETNGDTNLANYVSNDNGKLYNFIPGKVYYWESASDSSINGYVRPTGERRLITIPGTNRMTRNVRDLGGLPVDTDGDGTIDGTVKYQKIYRGEKIWGTNHNGVTRAQFEKLGIYNELDLRTQGNAEIVTAQEDQLINYNPYEIVHYKIDYTEFGSPASETQFNGKSYYQLARDSAIDVMQKIVAGNDDYAIYFHCRIGADRTGTLAYILEGLLGVPTEYRYQDYELTTFFGLRERTRYYYNKGSNNYKFLYLKKAIRHATPNNDEITGEENVMDWFLLEGNSTPECNDITALINQFRNKMIDYN